MCVITLKDDNFIFQNKYDAKVIFPFIFIKESCKDDKGLIIHEKTHIKQVLLLKGLLYYFSKEMRYKLELEAYQNQLYYNVREYKKRGNKDYNSKYESLAKSYSWIMNEKYNLSIGTYDRAFKDFMKNIDRV